MRRLMLSGTDNRETATIARPYIHDRIEVTATRMDGTRFAFSLLGSWRSEYASGPSTFELADHCGQVTGERAWFGLRSCRRAGFQVLA